MIVLTLVTLGNPGTGVWEVCRHNGGEEHRFLSGDPSSGVQAEGNGYHHSPPHNEASHHCGEDHHGDHHEPCDHEFFFMDHDWSLSGSRVALTHPGPAHTLPLSVTAFGHTPSPRRLSSSHGVPRAPPESWECNQFVSTIRLLV